MGTVTGKSATVRINGKAHSTWGISDFSLTFDKGTVEQELVGETGNYFDFGSLSVNGSYTCCKFAASGNADALINILDSADSYIEISGTTGSNLSWYFKSCQITGYDVSVGDADTITEASIDWVQMSPDAVRINTTGGHVSDNEAGV